MRSSKYDSIINNLVKKAVFTTEEAHEVGIPSRMLAHFCKRGLIERISRGIYKGGAAPLFAITV